MQRLSRFDPNALTGLKLFTAGLVFVMVGLATSAKAQMEITVDRGFVSPFPIAVTEFHSPNPSEAAVGRDIASVISTDLERSGIFDPIEPGAFIQDAESLQAGPRFGDWRLLNATALIAGRIELESDGRLRVEFRLWDVFAEVQLVGLAYHTTPENWRRVAHIIADAIYYRLTGEQGYFDTRIVYIAESGPQNRRVKRLAIMDQDGENHRFLTDGTETVLTPRFSPSTQEITYMVYRRIGQREVPRVYLFNLETGQQEVLGEFPGMTFAPRFSPSGNQVVFSLAENGNSEIYTMDLASRQVRRLTNHPAIDTSPSYSPDGQRIVFNSDRGGSAEIYTMNADGSNVVRISFGEGSYFTPVWSPRGDLIAFTRLYQGSFFVGVMRPDGQGERMIVQDYDVEAPTWAPNGRVLAYFRQTAPDNQGNYTARIYTIDITGYNERRLSTPLDGSDPAWSPLIP